MPRKNPPTGTAADLNLATMASMFANEDEAREFLEKQRWPAGPVCPHCACMDVYKLTAKPGSKSPVRPGVYKCSGCREQFTVRIGTIMEESKIPICKWLMAFHLISSSKKGISSHQIARECEITQKSAWFMMHRIREAMRKEPIAGMLKGTVQVDETYVGGKPRKGSKFVSKTGRGTKKTPVLVLVENDGSAVVHPVRRVNASELTMSMTDVIDPAAKVVTDDFQSYIGVGKHFAGGHSTVKHSSGSYVNKAGDNTNTAESFFALLKRGHYGIFHKLSKKHLHRYCNEFGFRWNHRKVSDGERMVAAIQGAEGKRLMYREPIRGLVS
jgi:transposase-like protein